MSDLNSVQRGVFAGGRESEAISRDLTAAVRPPVRQDPLQVQRLANLLVSALANRSQRSQVDTPDLAEMLIVTLNAGRLPQVEGGGVANVGELVANIETVLRSSGVDRAASRAVTDQLKLMAHL